MEDGNGKAVDISWLKDSLKEIKGKLEDIYDKLDSNKDALNEHCIKDHKVVDSEIAAIKKTLAYYIGGGMALFTVANLAIKLFA